MIDAHTAEGRRRRSGYTVVSGDYDTHRAIAELVEAQGWGELRARVHAELAEPTVEAQTRLDL